MIQWISIVSLIFFAACSIIADPDQFTYKEGSATDRDDHSPDTASESEETDKDDSSPDDSDEGSDSISDSDIDTSDSANPGDICESNDDCGGGAICPILFNTVQEQEIESHCYIDCGDQIRLCDETEYPLCYQHETGGVCLERATIEGDFTCRLISTTNSSQLDLKIRPKEDAIRLTQCEMYTDDSGFGFIFSTVKDDGIIEVGFYIPNMDVRDLTTGALETVSGTIYHKVLDDDYTLLKADLLGFFPLPDVEQDPALNRKINILEAASAGPIQGEIQFDGFAYDAKMSL